MNLSQELARHLREVHIGGNWTESNIKDQLSDVSWEESIVQVHGLNTIAMLSFHMHYFVRTVLRVLQGGPLDGDDKVSFEHPPINSDAGWMRMREELISDGLAFADLLESFPERRMTDLIGAEKYGTFFRNFQGIIEHCHYHLGQIAVIKKILRESTYQS